VAASLDLMPIPVLLSTPARLAAIHCSVAHTRDKDAMSTTPLTSYPTTLGKQARTNNHDDSAAKRHEPSPPRANEPAPMMNHPTEPVAAAHHPQPLPDAYSMQQGDMQNRVAQADNVAAHHAEGHQKVSKSRHDDAAIQKIIEEERASRSKFPKYPGLERWELLEKMGDGAFSNVYRARDLQGNCGECAIKVVRKFEMNNMQVSSAGG